MNQDERFQQRWEFRSSKVDGDTSSDDEGSNSRGKPTEKKPNPITDLVLFENDEANDDPGSHKHDNDKFGSIHRGIGSKAAKSDEKSVKSSKKKKKKVVQKKSEEINSRKRKGSINDKAMLKDLKMFADSLVHELAVERENMFAHMRDEMRKLAASESRRGLIKKNVRRSQNGSLASDMRAVSKAVKQANELHKGQRLRQSTVASMNSAPSNQLVSSSYIASPHLQNQRNRIHLMNDHIPCMDNKSGSGIEICKLMAAKSLSRRLAEFQPQHHQFGGFSLNYQKSWGVYGESQSHTSSGVGFPIPLNQGMDSGSNRSSMSFMNGSIARFPCTNRAALEGVIPSSIVRKSDGEFVAARSNQSQRDVRFNMTNTK
ncbi:hypothetical protein C2S53_006089 [Perilla frutescens var. hirtella]|uniref:Uncharacterized protein n=1 Tax=Perilla frutescens var. hirtella TaxID=608512 RepID=A0AAD4PDP6_PERFH|nr:hypothetical protein C2S53_006089 [Perilla frutescens var. hirtella]